MTDVSTVKTCYRIMIYVTVGNLIKLLSDSAADKCIKEYKLTEYIQEDSSTAVLTLIRENTHTANVI